MDKNLNQNKYKSFDKEEEELVLRLLKNRVQLRVLLFLYIMNNFYCKFQNLFQKLHNIKYNNPTSDNVDRSKIISYIQEDSTPISSFRAGEIIKLLEKYHLLIPKTNSFLTYYESPLHLIDNTPIIRPSYIAEYLNEDLQSVISALNSLRKIPLKNQGFSIKLVIQKRSSEKDAKLTGWKLLEKGDIIASKLYKILETEVENFENICKKLLELRQSFLNFKQKLNQLQDFLTKTQTDISSIEGISIEKINHFVNEAKTNDFENKNKLIEAINEDSKVLINFKELIKGLTNDLAEYSFLTRDNLSKIKALLESVRSVVSIESFKENIKLLEKNLENMNIMVNLPDLQNILIDLKERKRIEIKSLELTNLDFSTIEKNVITSLDVKFSLKRHLETLKLQNIVINK